MPDAPGSVVYMLPDKMGGVFNYVENLLANQHTNAHHAAILVNAIRDRDARSDRVLSADVTLRVDHDLPRENLYAALKRVAQAIPASPGVLVANDWIELAAETAYPSGRAVVSITHADTPYYYGLATKHQDTIDCFLTYTKHMYQRLVELLPDRKESIIRIPYGVRIPERARKAAPGPLRLLYVGRLDIQKGVFDLPMIDEKLAQRGVPVTWTIQGTGPDEAELRTRWTIRNPVQWNGRQSMQRVLDLYYHHDVLVMPSRSEGLPVALLEAGAAGVVPVVSNLATGIPEVVDNDVSGCRVPVGDVERFADAIERLHEDRAGLETMSAGVRTRVRGEFDIAQRAAEYEALYARLQLVPRVPRKGRLVQYGSRLDHPLIPNPIVRAIRGARQSVRRLGLPIGGVLE